MAEPKFTPDPWMYVDNSTLRELFNGCSVIVSAEIDDAIIATIGEDVPNHIGNAHLIAAAPDLYEALRDVEWAIDGFCPQCGRTREVGHQKKCALAKALAKARGEGK